MGRATKVCFLSSEDESRGLLGQTLEQALNISVAATWTSLLFNQRHINYIICYNLSTSTDEIRFIDIQCNSLLVVSWVSVVNQMLVGMVPKRSQCQALLWDAKQIEHFTVVCSVTWPLNDNKAEGDLVLIQTSLPLLCKSRCFNAN